jgi:hypothetical protein
MQTSETPTTEPAATAVDSGDQPVRVINSTDATIGQPIVQRVQTRQQELSTALAALGDGNGHLHAEITLALDTAHQLLSGDLANVPAVVAADMNRWLERNKHVAEVAGTPAPAPAPTVPDKD